MACVRRAFEAVYGRPARKLGMQTVYDVSHNLAKPESHGGCGAAPLCLAARGGCG